MDPQEYKLWKTITRMSYFDWQIDLITLHNKNEYFFYKGGQAGAFISITADGIATIGLYEDAIPHIGEATFRDVHKSKVAENVVAALHIILNRFDLTRLIEKFQLPVPGDLIEQNL